MLHRQEDPSGDAASGWRLSDKLYELSLEAEEEEKRQQREAALQAQSFAEVERERSRLRDQVDRLRDRAKIAADESNVAKDQARDREEAFAKEVLVLRVELARSQRSVAALREKLRDEAVSMEEEDDEVVIDSEEDNDDDDLDLMKKKSFQEEEEEEDEAASLSALAATGDESGLRKALSPQPRRLRDYRCILSRALITACEQGQLATAKLLLRRGAAGLARRRSTGWTALHAAAASGSAEVIEAIVATEACGPPAPSSKKKAPREDPLDLGDSDGKTALMVAAEAGRANAVRALMRAGADADLVTHATKETARDLASPHASAVLALESPSERFWNASAAGNRAWRRKDFSAALAHFSNALVLSVPAVSNSDGSSKAANTKKKVNDDEEVLVGDDAAPSGVDLARLELNCAKAALRLGRSLEAAERAEAALERHKIATRGGVYANALAVRAECRESLFHFEAAATDFDDLAKIATDQRRRDDARTWQDRAQTARDAQNATHYAVLGVGTRADDNDIRRAYRKASMRWHPDRKSRANNKVASSATDDGHDDRARAERHFRRINDAKETLLDAYKRAVYDVEHRRRIAAEADRLPASLDRNRSRLDAGLLAGDDAAPQSAGNSGPWPWHAAAPFKATTTRSSEDHDGKENTTADGRRYSKPWTKPSPRAREPLKHDANRRPATQRARGKSQPAAPRNETHTDVAFDDKKKDVAIFASANDDDKNNPIFSSRAAAAAANPEEEKNNNDDDPKPPEHEWSWRLRKYEDELRRQRDELERTRAARADAARERRRNETIAERLEAEVAAARAAANEGDAKDDLDDDDDLGASLADALGDESATGSSFFAPRRTLDNECDDDDVLLDDDDDDDDDLFATKDHDLAAQLRDAAEWFDQLDEGHKGELDMKYFDSLAERLGLRRVLGDDEMQRQRFFADPVGAGVLKRGAFLGWFAALLESPDIMNNQKPKAAAPRRAWPESSSASA